MPAAIDDYFRQSRLADFTCPIKRQMLQRAINEPSDTFVSFACWLDNATIIMHPPGIHFACNTATSKAKVEWRRFLGEYKIGRATTVHKQRRPAQAKQAAQTPPPPF